MQKQLYREPMMKDISIDIGPIKEKARVEEETDATSSAGARPLLPTEKASDEEYLTTLPKLTIPQRPVTGNWVEKTRISVATDVVTFMLDRQKGENYRKNSECRLKLLLMRGSSDERALWALPGGFIYAQYNERISSCAARVLAKKTGLESNCMIPVGVFDEPERDKRFRVISHAYATVLTELRYSTEAENATRYEQGMAAGELKWFYIRFENDPADPRIKHMCLEAEDGELTLELLLRKKGTRSDKSTYTVLRNGGRTRETRLAFDHGEIIAATYAHLRRLARQPETLLDLMPERFKYSELQQVQETFTGEPVSTANFRRKLEPYVESTGEQDLSGAGHRPAMLYKRRNTDDLV